MVVVCKNKTNLNEAFEPDNETIIFRGEKGTKLNQEEQNVRQMRRNRLFGKR